MKRSPHAREAWLVFHVLPLSGIDALSWIPTWIHVGTLTHMDTYPVEAADLAGEIVTRVAAVDHIHHQWQM